MVVSLLNDYFIQWKIVITMHNALWGTFLIALIFHDSVFELNETTLNVKYERWIGTNEFVGFGCHLHLDIYTRCCHEVQQNELNWIADGCIVSFHDISLWWNSVEERRLFFDWKLISDFVKSVEQQRRCEMVYSIINVNLIEKI